MELINSNSLAYFGQFEVEPIKSDPSLNINLFQDALNSIQKSQLSTFEKLENSLPLLDAKSFGDQVHFQNAFKTPIQRWFPYREGYSTRLVNTFLKELKISGNVFDPFSGSGTTLLASRHNDLQSFGVDVNPISVLVAKVENTRYDDDDVAELFAEIENIKILQYSTAILKTQFNLADKVFNHEILQSLLQIKDHTNKIPNHKVRDLIFVVWLAIIEDVSNIKKEGNGIKYKNRKRTADGYINLDKKEWEDKVFPKDRFNFVVTKLINMLNDVYEDLISNYGNCEKIPKIYKGSSLEFDKFFKDELDFTFYSPPYCNCFDYFEIHKVDLWLGEFITTKEEFNNLRRTGFRSNINSLNNKPIVYKSEYIEKLVSLFDMDKLWNTQIPNVVRGYFDDTNTLLTKIYQQSTKGGYVGIVIGNSAYSGVIIPSDLIVADIAREIGFKVKNIFVTRHLTTSSQQKQGLEVLKNFLRESIVLLQK